MNYWYNVLTFDERIHYERCVSAIIAYYDANIVDVLNLIHHAQDQHYTNIPLIAAIVWRLSEELS